MAVPEQIPLVDYVADGTVKKFDVPFDYDQQEDLHLFVDGIAPTIDKYFFEDNAFNFYVAPTAGQKVRIERITPKKRDTNYDLHTNTIRPKALNNDFDRIWFAIQESYEDFGELSIQLQNEIIARIQSDDEILAKLAQETADRILGDTTVSNDLKNYVNEVVGAIIGDPDFQGIGADKVYDGNQTQDQINLYGGKKYDMPVGGYPLDARVLLDNGDIVKSTIPNNTNDPNVDMTGWVKTNSASQIIDESGLNQQEINNSKPEELDTYSLLRSYSGSKINAVIGGRSNYFDGGFGRFAVKDSDTTSADNDGTIIVDALGRRWHRIIQTEYGNPEWFGMSESVADNAPLVEKCLNIVGSAFIRRGEFPILNTLRVLAGQMLIGQVDKSIFVINDSTKAGILTHDYSTNNGVAKTQQGISIKNIRVKGNAKFGFGFTHCTQGDFSGLSIDGLAATDGYIFEGLWNCHFNDFKSNGAILTGSAFKINKIVLNSEFRSFYSSNFCDFSLTVNSTIAEISVNNWAGFGDLIFEGLAAQGANKSGVNLVQANNIIFNGLYTESCLAALHIGTAQMITFNTCSFVGVRSASSLYEMWLGYSSANSMNGVVFNQCRHSENKYPIIMDYAGLGVTFNQPLVTFNTPLINKVQRTANTNGGMPLTIYRDAGGTGTTDVKKTNNYAWKFVVESVNDNNVVTRTIVIPPVTTATMTPL